MECDAVEEPPGDVWQPARPPRGYAAVVSTWGDATALLTHALGPHLGVLGGGAPSLWAGCGVSKNQTVLKYLAHAVWLIDLARVE